MFEVASIEERIRGFLEEPEHDLPVFNRTALLVQQELSKPDINSKAVISLIEKDQVLAGEVLKLANSSFFRGIKKIYRIQDAMVRIGLREMINSVMLASQRKYYTSGNPFELQYMSAMWQHSVACAVAAQWIALRCGFADLAPEAFIAGLLHDVGKLLVLKALVSVDGKGQDGPRITRETADEFLQVMHPDCGFRLMQRWNLPEEYGRICRDHHLDHAEGDPKLLVAVRLANMVCHKLGYGLQDDETPPVVASTEAGLLGLSEVTLADLEIAVEDYFHRDKE